MNETVSRELFDCEIASIRREIAALDRLQTELGTERNRAVDAALAAAKEKAAAHNDVLGFLKDQQVNFVTKDQAGAQFKGLATAITAIAALMAVFVYLSGVVG